MLLTAFLALASLHTVQASLQGRPLAQPATSSSSATAEGAEILRRILADALDQAFEQRPDKNKVTVLEERTPMKGLVTRLWAGGQTVQHSRVFHLPQAGLFFALDASLPVVKAQARPTSESSDQPSDDEWEKARRALHGDPLADGEYSRYGVAEAVPLEIDPQAIDKTIDVVLRTCARHAARIEGLAPQETMTIALRLSGRGQAWLHDLSEVDSTWRGRIYLDSDDEKDTKAKDDGEKGEPNLFTYSFATGAEVREQNLVIRVLVGDLLDQGGNVERLRQRAQIHRY